MYSNMAEVLDEGVSGGFELKKFEVGDNDFFARISGVPKGKYIKLVDNSGVVMSDTPMEKRTNASFVHDAFGDVLIGGLGIGLIILPLLKKTEVKSVTIIEKNQDVINLVAHQLPQDERLKINHADIFEYVPDCKYDCLYFDIWSYVNSDIYEEMKCLKRRYRKYRKSKNESPNGFIRCWAEWEAKNNAHLR